MFVTVMSRKYDEVIRKPNITIANADDLEQNRCWRENEKFYISSRGQVYPCCYVCCHIQDWCTHPSFFYLRGLKSYEHNIKYFPLSEIIKSDWFAYTYDSIDMCRMHCEV